MTSFPRYEIMLCIYGFLKISFKSQVIMYMWEVAEKMWDRIFRPLVSFLVGDIIQFSYTVCNGMHLKIPSWMAFLQLKAYVYSLEPGNANFIPYIFLYSSFPKGSNIKAINSQIETERFVAGSKWPVTWLEPGFVLTTFSICFSPASILDSSENTLCPRLWLYSAHKYSVPAACEILLLSIKH